MNFSSLLVREYIYQLYNELVVGIASKLEQRTKKEKKSGCGELMLFVLLPTSQRLTFISTLLLLNSCFFPQDLEVVVDQGEEEFGEEEEVRMDPAWTFLTSSAPLDLSLLKEGFQGENSRSETNQHFIEILVTGSQVSDSSFFGYSVIHHGRLCVIGHQKNRRRCPTV